MAISDVKPYCSVCQDSSECNQTPQTLISLVSIGANFEGLEISHRGNTWQNLFLVFIEVNLVQHEFAGFLIVGKLVNNCEIVWSHILVMLDCWTIGQWVFGASIALVQNSCYFACNWTCLVKTSIFKILWYPPSINENCACFSLPIQMSIEWSDNLNAFLTSVLLVDLDFFLMVENAFDSYGFERPFLLKLV